MQEKLSAVVQNGQIVLTPQGEHGRYIIKPAPSYKNLRFRSFIPANEHLTMQIAKQVFKMKVAENGIVFFANGEMAYITKRDDFITFANRIGVLPKKRDVIIKLFSEINPAIDDLIHCSFLDDKTKRIYKRSYQERLSRFLRE